MKYFVLIWAGIWRKRARTVLTLLSIVTAFMLYGMLHGVTAGLDDAIDQMSVTRLRVMNRVNIIDSLPLSYLPQIEALPNVEKVAYYQTFVGYYQEPTNGVAVGAVDIDRMLSVYPEIVLPDDQREAMKRTRTGAVIGRDMAEQRGWKIGDRIPISSQVFRQKDGSYDWAFDVVGIYDFAEAYEDFNASEMWVNYDYFDEARGVGNGLVILYFVGVDDADLAAPISESVDALFANSPAPTQTMNERDFLRAQINQLGDIDFFVTAIIGAVFFTLLFLTGNTMMQSVRERIPELAVLKTYGFGNGLLMTLVFAESLLLCVFAAAVGIAIAATFFPSILRSIGVGALPMPPSVFAIGIACAVLLAIVSALPPAMRAQRLNVVDALAGR
jgi:putative ABC transport system permease protein